MLVEYSWEVLCLGHYPSFDWTGIYWRVSECVCLGSQHPFEYLTVSGLGTASADISYLCPLDGVRVWVIGWYFLVEHLVPYYD